MGRTGFWGFCAVAVAAGWLASGPARAAAAEPAADAAARFRASLRRILSQPPAAQADWGILVVDQQTGRTLYERNAARYFTPASNTKLFTAAMALAELGSAYRWRTSLESAAPIGPAGTLDGDLVLVGRGDPNLSNRVFPFGEKEEFAGPPEKALADLADQAVAQGLKRINGDVVADDSYFTYERYPPGWTIDDLSTGYGAPVSAIVVDDNTLEVEVDPGARPGAVAPIQVLPWAGFYHFIDRATTGIAGGASELDLEKEVDSQDVTIEGTIAAGSPPAKLEIAIERPAQYAAALLDRLLRARGVVISGQPRVLHLLPNQRLLLPTTRHVLAEHISPTLGEEVRYLLKTSQNLHAECLLRTVAHGMTGAGSGKNGLAVEAEFLARLGMADDAALFDGSGLSRYDLVTPRAIVTLLRYAAKQSWGPTFIDALPVAGRDGTLEDRMEGMAAAGRIFAKTGSLAHDHALSGYATTLGGERLVFSILVNDIPPRAKFNPLIDAMANAMVEDLGGRTRRTRKKRGRTKTDQQSGSDGGVFSEPGRIQRPKPIR